MTHAVNGDAQRVTEADVLRHGLDQAVEAAEALIKENKELRERIATLELMVVKEEENL